MKIKAKIKKIVFFDIFFTILISTFAFFSGCEKNKTNLIDSQKTLKVYIAEEEKTKEMSLNSYLEGVVAGEIENDAPLEALKAQAVLARTFTLKFLESNKSKYNGADISSDITEAQAYNEDRINDNIKRAVKETDGKTIKYNGELISAYFHSNSGGQTTGAKQGLGLDEELSYLKSVKTGENGENSKNYNFSCSITKDSILAALRNMGISVSNISSFKKGEVDSSGRCLTFIIGSKEVNANTFRLNIGSTKLKSTLIDEITVSDDSVYFKGRGYGHGVGLSQEYAKVLASEGKNYKEIISFFYDGVNID